MLARARTLATSGAGLRQRTSAGLSLREVAQAVGVSPSTLWRWERGERAPRGKAAIAWASLLSDLDRNRLAASKGLGVR
jgi:transcriptional regulator with XRE-family HTH domain